jgi:SM-20-related protein
MLQLDRLATASVTRDPFPYMMATDIVDGANLVRVAADFPDITKPGIFPLSEVTYGTAFAELIKEVHSAELEALISDKFNVDLSDKPLFITVRGHCQKKDGRIHTDSKDKVITCLLYLNDKSWNAEGGRLRLLRDGRDLESTIAEVPPHGGTLVAFQRTDNSWHGHAPFVGPRRYIMFNWVRSDVALAKNLGRHKLSAAFKRLGIFDGY